MFEKKIVYKLINIITTNSLYFNDEIQDTIIQLFIKIIRKDIRLRKITIDNKVIGSMIDFLFAPVWKVPLLS